MTDEEDNRAWIEGGRFLSLFDNEALSKYFTHRAKLTKDLQDKFESALFQATDAGWRPKIAVRMAFEALERIA